MAISGLHRLFRLAVRRPSAREDVDLELRFHLESQIDELIQRGYPPEAAREEALRRFGDLERRRAELVRLDERARRRRSRVEWLEDLRRDLVYGVRGLVRAPGFALGVILTLGLGIGANAAILRLIDATLLHPLPGVERPSALVEAAGDVFSYPGYRRLESDAGRELALAAYAVRTLAVGVGERTLPRGVAQVSGSYFAVLGARMTLGRALTPGDDRPDAPPVAVVSHGLWERELGGRPDVVGQTVRVSGSPLTIVGVVGRGFRGLRVFESPDVWVPINTWPAIRPSSLANLDLSRSGWGWLTAFGRLRPGVSIERAEQVVKLASLRADEEGGVPERFRKARSLAPALAAAIGEAATSLPRLLGLLMGAVGLLLGLACANVATLLLARSYVRQRELAVRAALGGGRGRLLRQLLAEALLLGGLGGLAGFAIYHPGVALLRSAALPGGIRLQEVGLGADGRSIAAVAVLAVASALLVGLAPALRATSHGALTSSFGLAGRSAPRRSRLRAGLVALQVALAVVLLVGAGLFGRGLARALAIDTGFRADGLTVVSLNLGLTRYTEERARPFYQLVAERVKALPGVRDATWALAPPLASGQDINTFTVVGEPPNPDGNPVVEVNLVGPEFWDVMGSGVVSGRPLEPTDQATGEKVVVISEAMARKFWPDRDPLGVRLIFDDTLRVVGVARTIKYHALDESPVPIAYFAHAQANGRPLLSDISLVVQGRSVPPSSALIAEAIRSVDPNVAVQEVGDYPSLVARVLLPQRLAFGLLGGFALLALVVAAVGVYSVMSGLVATRMQEFGIRKALGATVPSLVALAIRDQGLPVAAGLVAGLLVATAAGRLATSLLYGVSAADPAALAIAGLGLAATAAAAAALPAWRGARSEPMATLRDE